MTSNQITKHVIEELTWKGFHVWRQNQVPVRGRGFIGQKGLPDVVGFCKKSGKALYAEIKGEGDSLSEVQIEFMTKAKEAGCIVMIAQFKKGKYELREF